MDGRHHVSAASMKLSTGAVPNLPLSDFASSHVILLKWIGKQNLQAVSFLNCATLFSMLAQTCQYSSPEQDNARCAQMHIHRLYSHSHACLVEHPPHLLGISFCNVLGVLELEGAHACTKVNLVPCSTFSFVHVLQLGLYSYSLASYKHSILEYVTILYCRISETRRNIICLLGVYLKLKTTFIVFRFTCH
jgi:hypothetical protein